MVGIITKLPNAVLHEDPPQNKHNVVNRNTPLLHIAGIHDTDVTLRKAQETRNALRQAIPDYTFVTKRGGHITCCVNQNTMNTIVDWLQRKGIFQPY